MLLQARILLERVMPAQKQGQGVSQQSGNWQIGLGDTHSDEVLGVQQLQATTHGCAGQW